MGDNNEKNAKKNATVTTLYFPIRDIIGKDPMKNIPLSIYGTMHIPLSYLPSFQGMTMEDLDTFLFEFDILCRSYDYISDA